MARCWGTSPWEAEPGVCCCRRGGEFLYAQSNKEITLIDTQSNQQHVEHKALSGKVNTLQVDETGRTLLTLTGKTLEVWDSEQGKILATVDGLAEPQFVVTPNPSEARQFFPRCRGWRVRPKLGSTGERDQHRATRTPAGRCGTRYA